MPGCLALAKQLPDGIRQGLVQCAHQCIKEGLNSSLSIELFRPFLEIFTKFSIGHRYSLDLHHLIRHNYSIMLHVVRDPNGFILSVSNEPRSETVPIENGDPELLTFLGHPAGEPARAMNDIDFVRVIEDVIDTLITTHVIRLTDLPTAAQHKLIMRKGLRNQLHGSLDLLGNDDSIF